MDGTSISYFPTAKTAISSICECINELTKMQNGIVQCGNRPPADVTLDEEQQEILCIKSNVVSRLEMLFKETFEGGQNTPPTTSHLAPPPNPFDFPTIQTAISTISKCIQELIQMRQLMRKIDKSLPQSESLDKEQQDVLRVKSSVVSQLEILFKTNKGADEEALDDDEGVVQGKESVGQQETEAFKQFSLHGEKETETNKEADEEDLGGGAGGGDDDDDDALVVDDDYDEDLVQGKEYVGQQKVGFKCSSVNAMKDTKGNYLCLSNGYEIWCLDLELSSGNTGPEPLPIISTLNLLGGEIATSVGLFNFESDAYIIGGKKLPASLKEQDSRNPTCEVNWGSDPEGIDLYTALCYTRGAKGTSRVTYRLSLDADTNGGILSLYKCDIEKLESPKFWPIVENIGGKLHVMDSCPFSLYCDFHCRGFVFSHEVCEGRGSGWKNIQTRGAVYHIFNHVVVGDRIYANTCERHDGDYFLEFDSQAGEWKGSQRTGKRVVYGFKAKIVWDILSAGIGRCAGEFLFPFPREEGDPRVFVLFAIVRGRHDRRDDSVATVAVAYLVTLTGQVICYQHVSDFYYFKDKLLQPCDMMAAAMIHVDGVDKDQEGTMCSVVSAAMRKDGKKKEYLFVNTFSVEMLTTSAPKVQDLLVKKASEVEVGPAVQLEFVRVTVKDRFIYETDLDTRLCGTRRCLSWRACFVSPSSAVQSSTG